MAQVYIPENKWELLQHSISVPDVVPSDRAGGAAVWCFGSVNLLVILVGLVVITLLSMAVSHWAAPQLPVIEIQLLPLILPVYAEYSLLWMLLDYLLSLLVTFGYGHLAAPNRRAERFIVPILNILPSIPILSFLPVAVLAHADLARHLPVSDHRDAHRQWWCLECEHCLRICPV